MEHCALISGSSNQELAKEISKYINVPVWPIEIKKFRDGEIYVHVLKSVRGSHVFIVQPTSPPANDNLMELLLIIDAVKRASAKEITIIVPYYGYSRQDRKTEPREPISAKVVANLIESTGADRMVTFDLHVDQIQGFFNIPVDNLEVIPLFAEYLLDKNISDAIVVAPDVGGAKRARRLAKLLDSQIAIIDKRRPEHGESEVLNIIGDVKDKTAIIIDDIIDSGGTILNAANALKEKGAKEVIVCATHALLSDPAAKNLGDQVISEVILTNSISVSKEKKLDKMKIISLASILAESIKRIHDGAPMGVLFEGLYNKITRKKDKNG